MKEIPMLFSTPMVAALLDKRKTQTRRIMKPQIKNCDHSRFSEAEWKDKPTEWSEAALKTGRAYCGMCGNGVEYSKDYGGIKCPYGQPGDLLYVRETFKVEQAVSHGESILGVRYKAGSNWVQNNSKEIFEIYHRGAESWRPSIHMPKIAVRIWLQKAATKVERACDISREDAIAEGLACISKDGGRTYKYGIPDLDGLPGTDNIGWPWHEWEVDPIEAFKKLWCKINGIETWNDWVWVNEFEIISTTGHP